MSGGDCRRQAGPASPDCFGALRSFSQRQGADGRRCAARAAVVARRRAADVAIWGGVAACGGWEDAAAHGSLPFAQDKLSAHQDGSTGSPGAEGIADDRPPLPPQIASSFLSSSPRNDGARAGGVAPRGRLSLRGGGQPTWQSGVGWVRAGSGRTRRLMVRAAQDKPRRTMMVRRAHHEREGLRYDRPAPPPQIASSFLRLSSQRQGEGGLARSRQVRE